MAGASDARSEFERQLIVFLLHGEHYGLPIASVREIISYTPPRVTAMAQGLIQGLITLRGRVLPVLDLSSRLGQVLEVSNATRILVVEVSGGVVGLIVDGVDGVVQVAADRIEPIPGAVTHDALGDEIAAIDDRLVMLIDPERALGQALPVAPAREQPGERARGDDGESARGEPGDEDPAGRAHAPEPPRAPRPSGAPPARRRSAATPRPRRRPRHTRESEE